MIDHLLKSVITLFEIENRQIKVDFLTVFQWILILGCFIYILAFFLVMAYFLRNLNLEYYFMKRGIQIIPFKRLCEGISLHYYYITYSLIINRLNDTLFAQESTINMTSFNNN